MSFNMYVPTRFVFGNGRLSELSQYKMPGKKAMIVTTNGTSVFKNGAYDNTVEQLNKAGVASVLFNEVQANPLKSTVMNGAAFVKENQCDFIVALAAAVLWMLPKRWHLWPPIRVTYGIILWAEAEKVSPCRRNRSPLYVLQQPQAPVLKQTNGASSAMMNEMKKSDLAVGTNYSLFFLLSTRS